MLTGAPFMGGAPEHEDLSHAHSSASARCHPWQERLHLIGLDVRGAIVLRQKLSRGQVEARLANMPACLIGMEARVGAHHLILVANCWRSVMM